MDDTPGVFDNTLTCKDTSYPLPSAESGTSPNDNTIPTEMSTLQSEPSVVNVLGAVYKCNATMVDLSKKNGKLKENAFYFRNNTRT